MPLMIECYPGGIRNSRLLVEYLHNRDTYLLSSVAPAPEAEELNDGEPTPEMIEQEAYLREPLIRVQRFLETRDLGRLARKVKELRPQAGVVQALSSAPKPSARSAASESKSSNLIRSRRV